MKMNLSLQRQSRRLSEMSKRMQVKDNLFLLGRLNGRSRRRCTCSKHRAGAGTEFADDLRGSREIQDSSITAVQYSIITRPCTSDSQYRPSRLADRRRACPCVFAMSDTEVQSCPAIGSGQRRRAPTPWVHKVAKESMFTPLI